MQNVTEITQRIRNRPLPHLRGLTAEPRPKVEQKPITQISDLDTNRHTLVSQMVQAARDWSNQVNEGIPTSLVLMSDSAGVGKTHTAKSIWWSVCNVAPDGNGGTFMSPKNPFWDSSIIFSHAYALMLSGEQLYGRIRKNYEFVIIDDLGKEAKPQYVAKDDWGETRRNVWFSVINHCYRNEIPMVITTNKTMKPDMNGDTLESWIGRYALDRLFEMAPRGYMIDLSPVTSYRKEASGR